MPSVDVVSKTDMAEVENAIQGAMREIGTRFDFKGSKCSIELVESTLVVIADDDLKLKQTDELIRGYLTRRKVDAGAFEFGPGEKASGNTLRQVVTIKQGIDREVAQKITKAVKGLEDEGPSRYSRRRVAGFGQEARRPSVDDRVDQRPQDRSSVAVHQLSRLNRDGVAPAIGSQVSIEFCRRDAGKGSAFRGHLHLTPRHAHDAVRDQRT